MCAELPLDSVQTGPTLDAAQYKTLLWMFPAIPSPGRRFHERIPTPRGSPCHPPSRQIRGLRTGIPTQMDASRTVSFFSTRPPEKGQQVSNLGPEGDRGRLFAVEVRVQFRPGHLIVWSLQAAPARPRSLLQMKVLRPHPSLANSLCVSRFSPSRLFFCTSRFEDAGS